jgi:hypothetical protein
MFMKTMAVGPLDPVVLCATGATVALLRRHCNAWLAVMGVAEADRVVRCAAARERGARRAIAGEEEAQEEEDEEDEEAE